MLKLSYTMSVSKAGKNSAAAKITEVVGVVLDLAFPARGDRNSLFWKKLRGADKRDAQTATDDRGLKAEATIPLSKLHRFYNEVLKKANFRYEDIPEKTLRTMADFYFRMASAGRTNTATAILDGTFILPKGVTEWRKVKPGQEVSFRLHGTKAAHLKKVDSEVDRLRARSAADGKRHMTKGVNATGLIRIRRPDRHPTHNRLDYWEVVAEYMDRVRKSRATNPTPTRRVQFDDRSGKEGGLAMHNLHNLFVGVTTGKFAGSDVKATTLDTCINNDLVASKAIQANRLQKSSNIRHTLVTCSLHFAAISMTSRSSRPSQQTKSLLGELYSRSMHSQSQAESTYSLALCDDHHTRLPLLDQRLTFDNFILHL